MLGRRKKNAKKNEAETVAGEAPVALAEAPREEPKVLKSEEPPKAAVATDRFRSWVTDRSAGYERLTDEKANQLVLKFVNKPESDVLDKLKDAGFRYQPDYFGHKKVWTRRNDFEGRERLRDVEAIVRGHGAEVVPF